MEFFPKPENILDRSRMISIGFRLPVQTPSAKEVKFST